MKQEKRTKKKKTLLFIVAVTLMYPATYGALRLTKYFVRQEFETYACSTRFRANYPDDDTGPVTEGYTTYACPSVVQ
jgi:hypothetical protein